MRRFYLKSEKLTCLENSPDQVTLAQGTHGRQLAGGEWQMAAAAASYLLGSVATFNLQHLLLSDHISDPNKN